MASNRLLISRWYGLSFGRRRFMLDVTTPINMRGLFCQFHFMLQDLPQKRWRRLGSNGLLQCWQSILLISLTRIQWAENAALSSSSVHHSGSALSRRFTIHSPGYTHCRPLRRSRQNASTHCVAMTGSTRGYSFMVLTAECRAAVSRASQVC